jgi:predicted ATPase
MLASLNKDEKLFMSKNKLISLHIKNFRSLAKVNINTDSLTVLFGPNGAGKSTFLDALRFARDCAFIGVEMALSHRNEGIGARWDGAVEGAPISIGIETEQAFYEILFGYSGERIKPVVREKLYSKNRGIFLIDCEIGDPDARHPLLAEIDNLLRSVRYYQARSAKFESLRKRGSKTETGFGFLTQLNENCDNLWAVLRHLHEKRLVDKRYDTIMEFMQESFPSFRGIVFEVFGVCEETAPDAVSASFIEKGRHFPIPAFGVADSYLQMLVHLTALFSDQDNALILLDEPELSLHPWALSVLADAVEIATQKWNKQVLMATQSPVLISQFKLEYIFTAEIDETGQCVMTRVSDNEDIIDLVDDYEMGLLYMSELIAPQSQRLEIPAIAA